ARPSQGCSRPMAEAKANPEAACPDGNDVEAGIRTSRWPGTPALTRSGRCRDQTDLTPRFTSAEVTPMASVPRAAALRPERPPATAIPAAMASHRRELLAALESRRSGSSRNGVGVAATAE